MKLTTLMCFVFSLFLISNLSAQDHQFGRAPKQVVDNQNTKTVVTNTDNASAWNSRFFGCSLINTIDINVKGFLNTPGTLTTIGPMTRNLYAGAWANGKWYAIDFQAQTTSLLGTIDTVSGAFTSIATITGMAAANTVTGMSYDKTTSTMYVVSINSTATLATVYTIDLTTAAMTTVTTSASGPIDISFNNAGVMYACDLVTDNLITINKTSGVVTIVGPLGINLNYAQGMCFDPQTDSLFLAAYTTAGNLYRASTTTGTATLIGAFPVNTEMDAFIIPGPSAPPPSSNTLVLLNDSTLAPTLSARRKADRDTLKKYLPMVLGNFTYYYKDTTAADVPTNLNDYSTIIVQETSYDYVSATAAGGSFVLTGAWRTAIKNWLNGGSPTAKRTLVFIGGDFGYAYDQSSSTSYDTTFSRGVGGSQYVSDNAGALGFDGVYMLPNAGNIDNMDYAPSGYYPDGCKPVSGGAAFTRYKNRPTTDSSAGITKSTANWNFIGIFQDPRFYTGTGTNPNPDQGFKRALSQIFSWIKTNGGSLTSVEPVGSEIASEYKLSQNYPNPFNPSTKINFSIPKSGLTTLKVYNILGKEVATLVNNFQNAGNYVVEFDASRLASGAYFYRLEVNGFVATKKMLLIK